jgi:hypothetical protein
VLSPEVDGVPRGFDRKLLRNGVGPILLGTEGEPLTDLGMFVAPLRWTPPTPDSVPKSHVVESVGRRLPSGYGAVDVVACPTACRFFIRSTVASVWATAAL